MRFSIINLGCRVNRVEADMIAEALLAAGAELAPQAASDVIIVNTCAVTGEAEAKTRKTVARAVRTAPGASVVACGCAAQLFSEELARISPSVVIEKDKSRVAALALELAGVAPAGEGARGHAMPTATGRTRPGIKIQDGCDNRCSFCIVWKARGKSSSVPVEQVIAEADAAIGRGAREIVLTGINIGDWRADGMRLPGLMEQLLTRPGLERLRLSSIEPPDVDEELLSLIAASAGRVAPFLHICLQSGSEGVLSRMRRVYTAADYARTVARARELVPEISLGTDLIVGFPGETDAEFEESLAFCSEMGFSRMHVFRYSKRPGTPAAEMEGQVSPVVAAERSARMIELAEQMRASAAASLVGSEQGVVMQSAHRGVTGGLFDVRTKRAFEPNAFVTLPVAGVEGDVLLA